MNTVPLKPEVIADKDWAKITQLCVEHGIAPGFVVMWDPPMTDYGCFLVSASPLLRYKRLYCADPDSVLEVVRANALHFRIEIDEEYFEVSE